MLPNRNSHNQYNNQQGSSQYFNQVESALQANQDASANQPGLFDPLKNFLKTLGNAPLGGAVSPYQPVENSPAYYQVAKDDKSLEDVSKKTGLPLDKLAELNNTKSLPPSGSYIQLKPEQLINQGVPVGVANMLANQSMQLAQTNGQGRGDPAAQALRIQANDIMKQLMNNQMPNSIPSAVVGFLKDANGVPFTIKDFLADGYVMDSKGILVRGPAAGQPTTTNNWQTNPALQLVRFNKNAKNKHSTFNTTLKWAQNAYRRKQRAAKGIGGAPAAAAATPGAAEAQSTILDIHLGSG